MMSLVGDILALYNNICQKTTFVKNVIGLHECRKCTHYSEGNRAYAWDNRAHSLC